MVFLSYHRSDSGKARTIAALLERHGHKVWWDRFIRGGTQYSKEIEKELKAADVVVVLWSTDSSESPWVRDEAAAGRDSGRLVPITIDGTEPPLGFRQFQAIDLSPRRIDRDRRAALLEAIDGISGSGIDPGPNQQPSPPASRYPAGKYRIYAAIGAVVLAAIVMVSAIVWQPWRESSRAPLVAVVAATPGSEAQSLASDLLIKLGVLQSSHGDALQLVDANASQRPDFVIRVGSVAGSGSQANLMLVDDRAGTLLWSEEFKSPSGKPADLRQQMAYSAAKVLECAVQATAAKVSLATLKLYLSGCANLSSLLAQDPRAAVGIFERITEQSPRFGAAWKKLILADIQTFRVNDRSDPELRRKLQRHAAEARRIDPDMAETFLAESWLRPPLPVAGWINLVQQAVAKDPDNPEILAYQSLAKANVGLLQEALANTRQAVKSDPLSPSARDTLITALLNSGQAEAAREELAKSERLWPGATNVLQSRFSLEFRVGDATEARRMMRSGQLGAVYTPSSPIAWMAHESYLVARLSPTPSNKRNAISNARALNAQDATTAWVMTRALSEFGALDELLAFLMAGDDSIPPNTTWTLFRSTFSPLHRDPRFMRVAARYGLVEYWTESGTWPDFCSDPAIRYDCKTEAAKLRRSN